MQDVTDNMDEFYKKAAEEYPLKTDTSDWESVQKKLHVSADEYARIIDTRSSGRIRKGILIILVLMVPTSLFVTHYFIRSTNEIRIVADTKEKNIQSPSIKENGAPIEKEQNIVGHANKTTTGTYVGGKHIQKSNDNSVIENKISAIKGFEIVKPEQLFIIDKITKDDRMENDFYVPVIKGNETIVKRAVPETNELVSIEKIKETESLIKTLENNTNTEGKKAVIQPVANNKKPKRFYMGVIMAPELTSVKFQPVKRLSFNQGVLMGYKLNDKFHIEVGVTLAHKYYYTEGKYLADNSIRGDNSNILKVNAYNNITEIPLNLRYNIKSSPTGKFFTSLGGVSYVMHKEQYSYIYTKNGEEKQGIKYNNKASRYWFSSAQLSVGYERVAGKIGEIRVEPYYRIPLHGIGISDLPVSVVGLNVAFTKSLK